MDYKTNHAAEDPVIECVTYYKNDYTSWNPFDRAAGCQATPVRQDASLVNAMAIPVGGGDSDYCHCAPEDDDGGVSGI